MTNPFDSPIYTSDGDIVSFNSDGVPYFVTRDSSGVIKTFTQGVKGSGFTTVIDYDNQGRVSQTWVAPYANGLIACGPYLLKDGALFYGMGCNYYDAIDHDITSLTADFALLVSMGVPCIRLAIDEFAAGNSPTDEWRDYFTDKTGWYAKRDALMAAAQATGIGVVMSMFWRHSTIPDLMLYNPAGNGKRDALDQWGVANSYTRQFMRQVTTELVTRYKDNPSLWGWEIGNEWHNDILITPYNTTPPPGGGAGGPATYSVNVDPTTANGLTDICSYRDTWSAFADWISVVQQIDPSGRMLSSGFSMGNVNLYQLVNATGIPTTDTYAQWMNVQPGVPAPIYEQPGFNTVSAHIYEQAATQSWYFSDAPVGVGGIIQVHASVAKAANRVFVLGEFGAVTQSGNGGDGTRATELTHFNTMVEAIIAAKVPLSFVWNYGYLPNVPSVKQFNINIGTTQEYQLRAIAGANARLQTGS